jgi:hypothetical protein
MDSGEQESALNPEIVYTVYFKDGKKSEELLTTQSFLMNGLVEQLYERFENEWEYCCPYFADTMNHAYGRLLNTEETRSKVGTKLVSNDFDLIVLDNCIIKCVLWLKSDPDRPTEYLITKKELLQSFIKKMNELHGSDWTCFETFFKDTGNYAYGTFCNDGREYLTFAQLKCKRYKLNRVKWENEKLQRQEIFYILSFKNEDFIKIGHTFNEIEFRLYSYLFPNSIFEQQYEKRIIDFKNSFILKTDITLNAVRMKDKYPFEGTIKRKFKDHRYNGVTQGKAIHGRSTEILDSNVMTFLLTEIRERCNQNLQWQLQTLEEYTGFSDSKKMRKFNLKKGIISKSTHFFKTKEKPKVFINHLVNNILK